MDGSDVEFWEQGQGDPILLIHGGVFSDWFVPILSSPALANFRLIRVRRAGYGPTPPPQHLTVQQHARHCAAVLDHLAVDSAHLVGHSSGACIALQLALDRPTVVRSLTLIEPAPGGALKGPGLEEHGRRVIGPAMGAFARGDLAAAFDTFLRGVGGDSYRRIIETQLGSDGIERAIRQSRFFFADEILAVREWTFGPQEGSRIVQPTLFVLGGESAKVTPLMGEVHEAAARLVPGAGRSTFNTANHLMPLADPDGVARLVSGFVKSRAGITPQL